MTPTKSKSLIPKTVELTGFTEEQVLMVLEFYYKEVRAFLSNLTDTRIKLENFGHFYIKEREMQKYKEKFQRILNWVQDKQEGARKESIIRNCEFILARISDLEIKLQAINNTRYIAKQRKDEYINTKNKESLERQVEDSESNNKYTTEEAPDSSDV